MTFIAPIVEGHGEVEALPALLHRIARTVASDRMLQVNEPIRVKSGSFLNRPAELQRFVQLAALKAEAKNGSILILLDCDDGCPAELGPRILKDSQAVRPDVPVFVALAYREYETWLIASALALRGKHGLPDDLLPHDNPEALRDAKGWLGKFIPGGYDPITHQAKLTRHIDMEAARAIPSFERLYQHIGRLMTADASEPGGAV
jgi:hypothetical protein